MSWLHSPWPLFSNDLDLARSWLRSELNSVPSLRAGHIAISLGMGDELLDHMHSGLLHADPNAVRQWRFRLARLRNETNPYRQLLPEGLFEQSLEALAISKLQGKTLEVELNGGIGDHLEALSLIIPWAKSSGIPINLAMSDDRQQQIEPLLPQGKLIKCISKNITNTNRVPIMALRAALMNEATPILYNEWAPKPQSKEKERFRYLCCWRAEGVGDKFSAHSRSIPWTLVYNFYQKLITRSDKACIIDITNWKGWESARLGAIGINMVDPRKGSLLKLIGQCQNSHVITIDTALVHLCAASGVEANLLLNIFPDERWQELNKPAHNYGQLVKLWRSPHFGSWEDITSSLVDSLSS